MTALTSLTIVRDATDVHLKAINAAHAPLVYLDVSYSDKVTDNGITSLLLRGGCPATTLRTVNLFCTAVTSTGCYRALVKCPVLCSIVNPDVMQALQMFMRVYRGKTLALTHLWPLRAWWARMRMLPVPHDIARTCPKLTTVVVNLIYENYSYTVESLVAGLPTLTNIAFQPYWPESFVAPSFRAPHLTHLHLEHADKGPQPITWDLPALADSFPALTHLTLVNVILALSSPSPPPPPSHLISVKLLSPYDGEMEPTVSMWVMVWARDATRITLGFCDELKDGHICDALDLGALRGVENLQFVGANELTADAVKLVVQRCPALLRLDISRLGDDWHMFQAFHAMGLRRLDSCGERCQSFVWHIRERNHNVDVVTSAIPHNITGVFHLPHEGRCDWDGPYTRWCVFE